MQLVFRYDDFSASASTPYEVDEQVFNLFSSMEIPLLVGVTPRMVQTQRDPASRTYFPLENDEKRLCLLKHGLEKGWQLALHGFTHQRSEETDWTEFAGLARDVQDGKITSGLACVKRCFPGAPVRVFIPPWNSFDAATMACLEKHQFQFLCGGEHFPRGWGGSMRFVPSLFSTAELIRYMTDYSLADLSRVAARSCVVVTLHHYDFWDRARPDYIPMETFAGALRDIRSAGVETGVLGRTADISRAAKSHRILQVKIQISRRNDSRIQRLFRRILAGRPDQTAARSIGDFDDHAAYALWMWLKVAAWSGMIFRRCKRAVQNVASRRGWLLSSILA